MLAGPSKPPHAAHPLRPFSSLPLLLAPPRRPTPAARCPPAAAGSLASWASWCWRASRRRGWGWRWARPLPPPRRRWPLVRGRARGGHREGRGGGLCATAGDAVCCGREYVSSSWQQAWRAVPGAGPRLCPPAAAPGACTAVHAAAYGASMALAAAVRARPPARVAGLCMLPACSRPASRRPRRDPGVHCLWRAVCERGQRAQGAGLGARDLAHQAGAAVRGQPLAGRAGVNWDTAQRSAAWNWAGEARPCMHVWKGRGERGRSFP